MSTSVSADMHLAQVNIARMNAPLDSAEMTDFVARIAEINALADTAPGFVWRLATEQGDATYLRPYDDDRILFNMSVWQSVEALRAYVYGSAHTEVMRRRHRWFAKFEGAYLALWWVRAGEIPSIDEAKARLARLDSEGPSPAAFTFKQLFPPPA
jgi:heme-degrading monooxygenase HmoA